MRLPVLNVLVVALSATCTLFALSLNRFSLVANKQSQFASLFGKCSHTHWQLASIKLATDTVALSDYGVARPLAGRLFGPTGECRGSWPVPSFPSSKDGRHGALLFLVPAIAQCWPRPPSDDFAMICVHVHTRIVHVHITPCSIAPSVSTALVGDFPILTILYCRPLFIVFLTPAPFLNSQPRMSLHNHRQHCCRHSLSLKHKWIPSQQRFCQRCPLLPTTAPLYEQSISHTIVSSIQIFLHLSRFQFLRLVRLCEYFHLLFPVRPPAAF